MWWQMFLAFDRQQPAKKVDDSSHDVSSTSHRHCKGPLVGHRGAIEGSWWLDSEYRQEE